MRNQKVTVFISRLKNDDINYNFQISAFYFNNKEIVGKDDILDLMEKCYNDDARASLAGEYFGYKKATNQFSIDEFHDIMKGIGNDAGALKDALYEEFDTDEPRLALEDGIHDYIVSKGFSKDDQNLIKAVKTCHEEGIGSDEIAKVITESIIEKNDGPISFTEELDVANFIHDHFPSSDISRGK